MYICIYIYIYIYIHTYASQNNVAPSCWLSLQWVFVATNALGHMMYGLMKTYIMCPKP